MSLGLVYLVREADGLERFAQAYDRHEAGVEHRIVLVVRDKALIDVTNTLATFTFSSAARVLPAWQPWHRSLSSFRLAAESFPGFDRFVFLNFRSRPLAHGWLRMIAGELDNKWAGIAGATGSWESFRQNDDGVLDRALPSFPNPHVRLNAFALRRADALAWLPRFTPFKFMEHLREAGHRSITRRCWASGRQAIVVGRHVRSNWPGWNYTDSFRIGSHAGLLVADDQTDAYIKADDQARNVLRSRTWGI